jgi:predicted acylesterase/phospholipase RssA
MKRADPHGKEGDMVALLCPMLIFFVFQTLSSFWSLIPSFLLVQTCGALLTLTGFTIFSIICLVGSSTLRSDLLLFSFMFVAGVIVRRVYGSSSPSLRSKLLCFQSPVYIRKADRYASLVVIFGTWLGMSALDHLGTPSAVHGSVVYPTVQPGSKHIGLALSGGGYRAVLLHAGVLSALEDFEVPISSIASVSGGSIIAASYAQGVKPLAVVEAVAAGNANVYRKLIDIDRASGLLFVAPGDARLRAQEAILDQVFLGGSHFYELGQHPLHIMAIASDLKTGRAVGMTPSGYLTRSMSAPVQPRGLYVNQKPLTLLDLKDRLFNESSWVSTSNLEWPSNSKTSAIVAASGAFPVAFEPLKTEQFELVDGGVTDNSAMTLLLDADFFARYCDDKRISNLSNWNLDFVVSSDASQPYDSEYKNHGILAAGIRALDTAYARVSLRPIYLEETATASNVPPAVLLSPSSLVRWKLGSMVDDDFKFISESLGKLTPADLRKVAEVLRTGAGANPAAMSGAQEAVNILDGHESNGGYPSKPFNLIFNAVQFEVRQDAAVFYRSRTLSANYSRDDAYRLYRLGWLLVALNSPTIKEQISKPVASKIAAAGLCPSFTN